MQQEDLTIFRLSLDRVTANEAFFDSFYSNFMAQSQEIAGFFLHQNMSQLKGKLRETLQMVSQAAEGLPGVGLYLEMLGRIHDRLKVRPEHFAMWQSALLDTVAEYDELFDERVKLAWLRVIAGMIAQMYVNQPKPCGCPV